MRILLRRRLSTTASYVRATPIFPSSEVCAGAILCATELSSGKRVSFSIRIAKLKDAFFLRRVIEGTKSADFVQTPQAVERVEIFGVAGSQLSHFQVTGAQIAVAENIRTTSREKMKAQPAAIGPRDALRFTKKGDEQKQDEIGIDLGLEFEIARK